jgi:hypothetical protein
VVGEAGRPAEEAAARHQVVPGWDRKSQTTNLLRHGQATLRSNLETS